jgi:hypothetical protein
MTFAFCRRRLVGHCSCRRSLPPTGLGTCLILCCRLHPILRIPIRSINTKLYIEDHLNSFLCQRILVLAFLFLFWLLLYFYIFLVFPFSVKGMCPVNALGDKEYSCPFYIPSDLGFHLAVLLVPSLVDSQSQLLVTFSIVIGWGLEYQGLCPYSLFCVLRIVFL